MPSFLERVIMKIVYFFMKFMPTQKKIVFMSSRSTKPSKDASMLIAELRRQRPDYLVGHMCVPENKSFSYFLHIFSQMAMLATSEIIITDSVIYPINVLRHKPWILIVYIPPYTGTIKKHDLSAVDTPSGYTSSQVRSLHLHRGYDFVTVNGEGGIDEAAAAYGYPKDKILVHPVPKVELLKNKSYGKKMKERIFAAYPKLREGKNILYCPTLRTNQKEHNIESKALFNALCAHEGINIIVKNHPNSNMDILTKGPIIDHKFTTFEMLFVADAIITDYSNMVFDASVLKKPIYLYAYDLDRFAAEHPFSLDYKKDMPGPVCRTAAEVEEAITCDTYNYDRLYGFLNKYIDTGGSEETTRLAEFILAESKRKVKMTKNEGDDHTPHIDRKDA
ncbi:MAG: CDP-glycerol glycerophosphotransferase family protein [Eubacteriaceae bacterium]|nr:CDP-glycerol glycerophosphotransferase family protein [Eubacteriaceae bacterium]